MSHRQSAGRWRLVAVSQVHVARALDKAKVNALPVIANDGLGARVLLGRYNMFNDGLGARVLLGRYNMFNYRLG